MLLFMRNSVAASLVMLCNGLRAKLAAAAALLLALVWLGLAWLAGETRANGSGG